MTRDQSIQLRPYQSNGIFKLKEKISFDKKKRIILMCPTGGGKGLIMANLVKLGLSKNSKVLTILYGSDLIHQTVNNYNKYYGIQSQIIMGSIKSFESTSMVASISTLHRRNLPDADFVIVDECQQSKSKSYEKIFKHYEDKIIIGLSATPFNNLDNFEDYIKLATVKELISLGFLVKPRHFAPVKQIKTDHLTIHRGEWQDDDLENEALKITGDVIKEWQERALDRPTVIFCVNVRHSIIVKNTFASYGIPTYHCDGETPTEKRDQAIRLLKRGKIKVITNVMVFSVGIDVPEISCVIMLRPTHSEILYIQQGGRGLRIAPDKTDCIVIDHANNVSRFGLLTDDRDPILTPKTKYNKSQSKATIMVWICLKCYCTNNHTEIICTDCHTPKPVIKKDIVHTHGALGEIVESPEKKVKIHLGNVMPFGKHKGTAFEFLPLTYLEWGATNLDNKDGLQMRFKVELQRRRANVF